MTTTRLPRRVRLSRVVHEQVGRVPSLRAIGLIEYPRIVSTCAGRAPIWEWRLAQAIYV